MENSYHSVYRIDILNQQRLVTDKPLLIFYLSLFLMWIPTIIYAFCAGDSTKIIPKNHTTLTHAFDGTSILIILGYALLSGFYASLIFIAMRWISSFSKVAIFMVLIPLASSILSLALYHFTVYTFYMLVGNLLSVVFVFVLISTEWFHLPEKILKESCRLALSFPVAMLFSFGCLITGFIIVTVTIVVELFLFTLSASFLNVLSAVINIVVGFWTVFIVFAYMQMVLCGTFATWFWAADKVNFEKGKTLLGCMKFTIKYHIGTLAYGTSIFGVFKVLVLLLVRATRVLSNEVNAASICFILYNFFEPIVFRFVTYSVMVKCAVTGKGFGESAEQSLNTLENHPRRCLVVLKITELSLAFAIAAITLLMSLSFLGCISYLRTNQTHIVGFIIAIIVISAIFVAPLFTLLYAAYYTILHCFLEDVEIHDGSQEKPYAMGLKLQSAIDHTGPPQWISNHLNSRRSNDEF